MIKLKQGGRSKDLLWVHMENGQLQVLWARFLKKEGDTHSCAKENPKHLPADMTADVTPVGICDPPPPSFSGSRAHRSYIFGKHLSLPLRLRIRRLYRRATTFSGNLLPLANIAGHDSPAFYHLRWSVGASTMNTGSDLAPLHLTSHFEI